MTTISIKWYEWIEPPQSHNLQSYTYIMEERKKNWIEKSHFHTAYSTQAGAFTKRSLFSNELIYVWLLVSCVVHLAQLCLSWCTHIAHGFQLWVLYESCQKGNMPKRTLGNICRHRTTRNVCEMYVCLFWSNIGWWMSSQFKIFATSTECNRA